MDEQAERILADLTERTMAAILHPRADIAATLGLIAKASSFLRQLAAVYQQQSDERLDTLLSEWAAADGTASQDLLEAPK